MLRKFFILAAAAAGLWAAKTDPAAFDADRYLSHIKYLASPELKGRATGSPELEKAAAYIADQFRADGLKPADGKSYLQPFQVTTAGQREPV
jgi:hypothetical protein